MGVVKATMPVVGKMAIMAVMMKMMGIVNITKSERKADEREKAATTPEPTWLPPIPWSGCYPSWTPAIAVAWAPIQIHTGIVRRIIIRRIIVVGRRLRGIA
jgi:hypothetical protein